MRRWTTATRPETCNTGAQAAIGPLPRWTSVYIVHPDVRAYNWMLANTDALGTYSIHYRDAATGWPVSIQKHPNVTIADWASRKQAWRPRNSTKGAAYKADLLPNCVNNAVVSKCATALVRHGKSQCSGTTRTNLRNRTCPTW